jgi:hypothetical protein
VIFKHRLANFEILFYIAQIYKSFVASLVEDFLIVHSHHEIAVELREFLQVYLPPLQGLTLANTYQLYNKCICDSVVVKYLQEHGFESIANKVLQIRGESGNSELELSNIVNKFNLSEEQPPREPYQWTTIREAYGDQTCLQVLGDDNSEVGLALKKIRENDIPIKKIYVATDGVTFF